MMKLKPMYKTYPKEFKVWRKGGLKKEFKYKIYKSIFKNLGCKNYSRMFAYIKIRRFKKKTWISKQRSACLHSGKRKGVHSMFYLSRHFIKSYAKENRLTNLKIKSW